jgi:hypothetical protein
MNDTAEIDALFQLPLAEFIAARNTAAARLRATGATEEAARIKALAKPSAAAWAVNQVYWTERGVFDALIEAAARLRLAQREGGSPDAIREAMRQRRDGLAAAVKRAEAALGASGHGAPTATVLRISSTFEALASQEGPGPTPGRLTVDLDPPGFEALAGMNFTAGPTPPGPPPPRPLSPEPPPADDEATAAGAPSRAALVEAEAKLRRCQDAEEHAVALRDAAAQRAEAAEQARDMARREAEKAEQTARAARESLADARRQADGATQARRNAESALEEARKPLAKRSDHG